MIQKIVLTFAKNFEHIEKVIGRYDKFTKHALFTTKIAETGL